MMAETAEELGKRPEIRKELERAHGKNIKKGSKLEAVTNSGLPYTPLFSRSAPLFTSLSARKSFHCRTLLLALLRESFEVQR